MRELCNCPMLDSLTPLMSWSNTPVGTPRRTPLPSPHYTPLLTPRATPRSTPLATPRTTPQRLLPTRDFLSPVPPHSQTTPRGRRFVQAPEIYSSFSSRSVEEGGSVELKCFISCAPLTTTTWEKDGTPLMSGSRVSISEKTGMRVLTLTRATPADAGNYRMTITNTCGVANCSANIDVKRK